MSAPRLVRRSSLGFLFGLALAPASAFASGPDEAAPAHGDDPKIYMGTPTETCAWPTTVAVQNGGSLCTGTLIHPRVVVYAAHCGASGTRIRFGEDLSTAEQVIPTMCTTNPGWQGTQGTDWATCLLPYDIPLPVTPAVYGDCEIAILQPGADIAIAGFGNNTESGGAGVKRWAPTILTSVNHGAGVATLGGGGNRDGSS